MELIAFSNQSTKILVWKYPKCNWKKKKPSIEKKNQDRFFFPHLGCDFQLRDLIAIFGERNQLAKDVIGKVSDQNIKKKKTKRKEILILSRIDILFQGEKRKILKSWTWT